MAITFQANGNLIPGIHVLTIHEIEKHYGYNEIRRNLIIGLKLLILHLSDCGCTALYVDGSFVSKKELPNDFDACWDVSNVDFNKIRNLYPIIEDFTNHRKNQKNVYGGEFFPMSFIATAPPVYKTFYDFFMEDRDGNKKGIIKIILI